MATAICMYCREDFDYPEHQQHGKYCSRVCSSKGYAASNKEKKRKLWEQDILAARAWVRIFLTEDRGYRCTECGISEWNNKPITLWVDHKDGNASNCGRENYQLVCPNCDSQSKFFGAKNYGNGRKSRGMKQYG